MTSKGKAVQQWLDLCAEEMDFRSLGQGGEGLEFAERRSSKAGVGEYLGQLVRDWDMVFYQVDDFIADGDRVAVVCRCSWTNRTTGKTVETPKVDIWHFRDGKAVYFMEYFDTHAAIQGASA